MENSSVLKTKGSAEQDNGKNAALSALYPANSVHHARLKTDAQFIDDDMTASFSGLTDETFRFVQRSQLSDPAQWARFVRQFRTEADTDGGWRGEYWGKMMRGASFVYAYTRDPALHKILTDTVEDLLKAEDNGRISTYPAADEFSDWDIWCRKYVLLGLQYYLEICTDRDLYARIVASMERQVRYLLRSFGPDKKRITEATPIWRGLAAASVLEPVVRLYHLTGEKDYLDFAGWIVSLGGTSIADIYEIAFEGETDPYQFPMTKAYEMISCFEGLIEYYRATGIEKYKTAAIRFGERAAAAEITVIGSAGCTHELFDHAAWRQTDTTCTGVMQETCVTVTWMKYCLQLLCLTGDARWADRFEQTYYNAYLGAVNTQLHTDKSVLERYPNAKPVPLPFDSYSPLRPGIRGRSVGGLCLMADGYYYGCCACIGAAGIGMTRKAALTLTADGAALNLFIPGKLTARTPKNRRLALQVDTGYPVDGTVKIAVFPETPENFRLMLRIPAWSEETQLFINGKAQPAAPGYAGITREWRPGDTVEVRLDLRTRVLRPEKWTRDVVVSDYRWRANYMVPRVITAPAGAERFYALRRGPLVLARDRRLSDPDLKAEVLCDENGFVQLTPLESISFPCQAAFCVPQADGGSFPVVDYASAGKTMDEASRCGCWFPI
ncbi:MAG: glycoside hydrolase family 127 protein [Clostridia bacterium]|nr:glycoside hydrolase family 127 protein [Clostridia bacterium]